jgi:hypothetical protein
MLFFYPLKMPWILEIWSYVTYSGNFTENFIKRFPVLYGVLWKGNPRPSQVIIESGFMIYPGSP